MTTRGEAFALLASEASRERLRGAQFFVVQGEVPDIPALRRARHAEVDTYVRRRLDLALSRFVATGEPREAEELGPGVPSESETYAKAIEWVGRLVLHEMEGPVGRADLYASMDIENYDASRTKAALDAVKMTIDALTKIVEASRSASREDFDMSSLVDEVVATATGDRDDVTVHGPRPFPVTSDPALIRLAVINGVKNAVEAVAGLGAASSEHSIVVTWGRTDREVWISVIDRGPGMQGKKEDQFVAGNSTKEGHLGLGLTVARLAMASVGGVVELRPAVQGGASYELKWNEF